MMNTYGMASLVCGLTTCSVSPSSATVVDDATESFEVSTFVEDAEDLPAFEEPELLFVAFVL